MRFTAGGASSSGPRPDNQDAYLIDVDLGLFVVADGMGGHNAGEVASRMAIDAVADFIRATRPGGEITWPFPFDPSRPMAVNRMDVALRIANQHVHDEGERTPGRAGMGTTIVALLIDGLRMVVGHVGDSRAYRWHGGNLSAVTRDDTWLNAVENSQDDLRNHPLRHVLTSGIGMGADLTPTVADHPLAAGDRWLLCSDGVHGYVEVALLASLIGSSAADIAAHEAVNRALAAGTTDNATAVVVNVD